MTVLAGVAVVMAYLGVSANRSADAAQTSAELAEDRLTQSLVAQGRRELNDNHELQALAYFAEALRRGADSPSLRLMIAYADRGASVERAVFHGRAFGLTGDGSAFYSGGRDGAIHVIAPSGVETATIATSFDSIETIRVAPGHRVVASASRGASGGIVVADTARRAVIAELTIPMHPWHLRLGPGLDEIAIVAPDGFYVYGYDGTQRRFYAASQALGNGDPQPDDTGRYVIYSLDRRDHVLDLVTMTDRELPAAWQSPWNSDDGTVHAVFDKDNTVHLLAADGTLVRTIPNRDARGETVAFSAAGDELAVVGEHDIDMFDLAGHPTGEIQVDSDLSGIALRGSDAWVGDLQGVVRHYHAGRLVGSVPSHLTEIMHIEAAGDAIASVSSDSTLVVSAADFAQLRYETLPGCDEASFGPVGPIVEYACGDKLEILLGRRKMGELPIQELAFATYSRPLDRVAVVSDHVSVFDRAGALVASGPTGTDHIGPIAYEDDRHLLVLAADHLVRWTIGTDAWDRVADTPRATAIAEAPAGPILGFHDGSVAFFAGGREARRLALHEEVAHLDLSPDARWLLVTLAAGDAIVVDVAAAAVVRKLTAGESLGGQASFDDDGRNVLRLVRAAISVTDRDTGVDLLFNFDLMRNVMGARGLADGRIELDGDSPALLDIGRDDRPRDAIVHAIECRVPLRVVDSALAPADPPPGC